MICIIINVLCILLFISSANVWAERENRSAAFACLGTGCILVFSIPTQLYLCLRRRSIKE